MTEIINKLSQAIGPEKVKTDEATLHERRQDYSVTNDLADLQGRGAPNPACVVTPKNREDVVEIVKVCNEEKALLVPFVRRLLGRYAIVVFVALPAMLAALFVVLAPGVIDGEGESL